jgi:hypothetical protein
MADKQMQLTWDPIAHDRSALACLNLQWQDQELNLCRVKLDEEMSVEYQLRGSLQARAGE